MCSCAKICQIYNDLVAIGKKQDRGEIFALNELPQLSECFRETEGSGKVD